MTADLQDGELVATYVRGGSEIAFRALLERHVDLVFATALRQVGDRGVAEEITQNVFIALNKKAPRLSRFHTLAGWLHRTTVLEARARVRSELRRKRREEVAVELAQTKAAGESAFAALLPLLDEALLSLNDVERQALISRFMQERSLHEVGTLLGIGEEAARKRVSRGLAKLADFFQRRGFAVPGTAAALLTAAIETAPPATAAAAAQLATVPASASGLSLVLFHVMNASSFKIAAAAVLLASAPLLWQERTIASARAESAAASSRLREAEQELATLSTDEQKLQAEAQRFEDERQDALRKLATLAETKAAQKPANPYRWDDAATLVRVPKELLRSLHLGAVSDRRGQLDPKFTGVFQMRPAETAELQTAMDECLRNIRAAEQAVMRPVPADPQDLPAHKREDVRAFEIGDITDPLSAERTKLFDTASQLLGPERFEAFKQGLIGWIPLAEPWQGVSASMALFDGPHRVYFGKPAPEMVDGLPWGMSKPGMSMSGSISVEEIPEIFAPALQDWIELARANQAPRQRER